MKKLMLSVFALAAVVFSANAETPSLSASVNGTGKAELVKIITLSTLDAGTLQFGQLTIPTITRSVTLVPIIGAASAAALGDYVFTGATGLSIGSVDKSTAGFSVAGVKNQTVNINLPGTATISNALNPGSADLNLTSFKSSLTLNKGTLSDDNGTLNFFIGATLTIPATAFAGIYSGTFPITVDYN